MTSVAIVVCGDGVIASSEFCDDGNHTSGDGCSSICGVEPGHACEGMPSLCLPAACGNGLIDSDEACDDGNSSPGDGCAVDCTTEEGWIDLQGSSQHLCFASSTAGLVFDDGGPDWELVLLEESDLDIELSALVAPIVGNGVGWGGDPPAC